MIMRVCVVIPSFDDARTISEVVKDVVRSTPFPVLIVDDGSETPVSHVLYSWDVRQALEIGRVRVLRSPRNRGRGAAIQTAITELLSQGFTHMLTMDASGRHGAHEIMKLIEEGKSHPFSLIVGDCSIRKNGFRLYPLFALQNMRVFSRRGDFDFEVLLHLVWRGIEKHEVPLAGAQEIRDRLWISFLDFMLKAVSALGRWRTPRRRQNFGPSSNTKRVMGFVLKHCGYRAGQAVARVLTLYYYIFSLSARRGMNEYWQLREPRESWSVRQRRGWRQIANYMSLWVDQEFQKQNVDAKFVVVHNGVEDLPEVGGAAHVSANVGAWEMVARLLESAKFCVQPDRAVTGEFELISFFGKLAPFDVTIFRRAGEKNCPLVFSFGVRRADGSYELQTLPMKNYYFIDGLEREAQVFHWAGEFVNGLESILKQYPEQWFNFYPFWSAVPKESGPAVLVEDLRATDSRPTQRPFNQPLSPEH